MLLVGKASGGRLMGQNARPVNVVRRVLRPGGIYLVAGMPSAEEIAAVRQVLDAEDAATHPGREELGSK